MNWGALAFAWGHFVLGALFVLWRQRVKKRRRASVVAALEKCGPLIGRELLARVALGPGRGYILLNEMESEGLIRSKPAADSSGRRLYFMSEPLSLVLAKVKAGEFN